jgi:GNAT superfamily N-acetyltransferase
MSPKFARELWSEVRDEALPVMHDHWAEVGYPYPLDLNEGMMRSLEGSDTLRLYSVRSEDGELLGYAGFMFFPHLTNENMISATELGVFLKEQHRHGRIAMQLLDYSDEQLEKDGASIIYYAAPVSNLGFGRLLEKRGFTKTDELFIKVIRR